MQKLWCRGYKISDLQSNELAIKNSPAYWNLKKKKTSTQRQLFKKYDKFDTKEFKKLYLYCRTKKIIL